MHAHSGPRSDPRERFVRRTIVDQDELVIDAGERGGEFLLELGDIVLLVVERDDDGKHPRSLPDARENREGLSRSF